MQGGSEAPASLALVGVQPALIDWSTDLTPAVAASVEEASRQVVRLVKLWSEGARLG